MMPSTSIRNRWWTENRFRWQLLHIAFILLAVIAAYSNSLHVQFVLDDDNIKIFEHKELLGIILHGGPRRAVDATFALNYHLHGLEVPGYHIVNVAIHLSATLTLYFLVTSAITALRISSPSSACVTEESVFAGHFVPLAVALLFAVHPIQTQAVTYIIQRYTSLATCFYLLSTLLFLRSRIAYEKNRTYLYPLSLGTLSVIAGLLAMGSKQIAITLPLMIILLEFFLFRGRMLNRGFFLACATLPILALVFVLVNWHDRSLHDFLISLHRATSEDHYISRSKYFLTQMPVVATYLRLLCLPIGQNLFHNYHIYATLFSLPVITSLALHISLLILAVVLFRRSGSLLMSNNQLEGVLQRLTSLGIVWFYIAIAVESSVIPITDKIFEHRIYLPSVGFFLTIAAGTALAVNGKRAGFRVVWTLLVSVSLVLCGMTIARNQIWSNSLTLWQDSVAKAPNNGIAVANLAFEYIKLDMPEKALPLYVRALVSNQVFLTKAKVYLGLTLQRLNIDASRFTTGEEIFTTSEQGGKAVLSRQDQNRLQCIMYNNMGLAYEYLGEPLNAREPYRAALLINPAYDLAWYNLGLLSIQLGDKAQVDNALIRLKELNPSLAESLGKAMHQ
jgi:tetratricopeptide (TPR) repeat protein